MKNQHRYSTAPLLPVLIILWNAGFQLPVQGAGGDGPSPWHLSVQYLGLTLHPEGGSTPEEYPLKLDKKAYLVLSVGAAANADYRLNDRFFFRVTSSLYRDCAFVTAGCLHAGPRIQGHWRGNGFNVGIGPIFSFRRDWHRFKGYVDDDFYGDRVWKGWQHRLYMTALELEYLRRINDRMELQWSLIPGAPLVITSLVGVRFRMD
jgi:hypothetical protein